MPVYEFVCKACGHHVEVSQSFKAAPLTTCVVCGGELRKVFSPVGIMFKGSGFYRTDNRGGSRTEPVAAKAGADNGSGGEKGDKGDKGSGGGSEKKADSKSDAGSDSRSGAKSGGKSDSKPYSKPAAKTGDRAKSA